MVINMNEEDREDSVRNLARANQELALKLQNGLDSVFNRGVTYPVTAEAQTDIPGNVLDEVMEIQSMTRRILSATISLIVSDVIPKLNN